MLKIFFKKRYLKSGIFKIVEGSVEINEIDKKVEKPQKVDQPPPEILPIASNNPEIANTEPNKETEVKTEIEKVITTAKEFDSPQTPLEIKPIPKPNFIKRVKNVFSTPNLKILSLAGAETVIPAYLLNYLYPYSNILPIAIPAVIGVAAFSAYQLFEKTSIPLGKFTSLKKDVVIIPNKKLGFGEIVGSFHLFSNLFQMGKLSKEQREAQLVSDSLESLYQLVEKIENNSPEVIDISIYKAYSHLVTQHPKIFQWVGFTIDTPKKSKFKKILNNTLGKMVFVPVFGITQLFKGHGLQGFKEANQIPLGEATSAYASKESLLAHKGAIERIKRLSKAA